MRRSLRSLALTTTILLLVGSALLAQDARSLVLEGDRNMVRGKFLAAIDSYRRAVAINPNDLDALIGLADAYFTLDEYDQAQLQVERARRLARSNSEVLVLSGRIAIARGDLEGADALFREVLAAEPNNVDASIALAELALAEGRSSLAMMNLEQALRVRPEHRRALLSLALVHEFRGDLTSAQAYIELAARVHRDRADVHVIAARYYERNGALELAARSALTALAIEPGNLDATRVRASVALESRNAIDAVALAEELIQRDRDDHGAWFLRAVSLRDIGRLEEAVTSIRTAISIAPDEELYRIWAETLALSVLAIDDPIRAEFARFRADEAEDLREEFRYTSAIRRYQRALQLSPLDEDLRRGYADVFELLGFRASYVQELGIADGESASPAGLDVIVASLSESVATQWGVDQFSATRSRIPVALYATSDGRVSSTEAAAAMLSLVAAAFQSGDQVNVEEQRIVADEAEAFSRARSEDVDFFIILDVELEDRTVVVAARASVTRTGVEASTIRTVRSGPGYLSSAADALVARIQLLLPRTATILDRSGTRVLVDRGQRDGITPEEEFIVLHPQSLVTSPESIEYLFAMEDQLGTATVTRVDDLVSEARLELEGLTDRVRLGDALVPLADASNEDESESVAPPERSDLGLLLYQRIRRLR